MLNLDPKYGFELLRTQPVKELEAQLHHLRHGATGLELIWLERADENKTFGIAFQTLPEDDTGVFHILEHSVLCGSDRYRLKEPFVELMKSSMNHLPQRDDLRRQDLLPHLQPQRQGLPEPHARLPRRGVPPSHLLQAGDLPPGGLALRVRRGRRDRL